MTVRAQFPDWSTAVPDWQDRIRAGRSLVPDLPLHAAYAAKAERIFRSLRVPDLPGYPTLGEVCGAWVFDLVRAVFGSYDPQQRRRHISEAFVAIPKKNAKSTIAAGIVVTATILNDVPDSQFVLIAPTMKIADIAYSQCAGMIRCTESIRPLFHERRHLRQIDNLNPAIPSRIRILAADTDVSTGLKNATVLIDEVHELARHPRADGIYVELRGALSHPSSPHFLLQITTQSKTPPQGVFRRELTRARAVRDGELALPLLPVIYELPDDLAAEDGWKRPETWPLVNPHLGRSVNEQFLADQLTAAEADGPSALALLASQHFNVQIGGAFRDDGWETAKFWAAAAEPGLDLDDLLARSDVAVVGVDGGGMDDLCGLCVVGRERDTLRWLVWAHAWAQPEVLERRRGIAGTLTAFADDGDLTICGEPHQHVTEVGAVCARVQASGLMPARAAIGLDKAGLPDLQDELARRGMDQPLVVGVKQGWELQQAITSLPLRVKAGALAHGGQPLMDWCLANAKIELRGNNRYMTKQLAGEAKIDPVIALLNAAMLMFHNPTAAAAGVRLPAGYRIA